MHDKLVDSGKPGDRVEITGIYRAMSVRVGQSQRTEKSVFKTYIDCLHIKKTDNSRINAEDPMEIDESLTQNDQGTHVHYEEHVEKLKELSKQDDIYEMLTRSLAPNIWELDDVKKGLLCQLFGGSALTLKFGASFRGDINILLVGDPGYINKYPQLEPKQPRQLQQQDTREPKKRTQQKLHIWTTHADHPLETHPTTRNQPHGPNQQTTKTNFLFRLIFPGVTTHSKTLNLFEHVIAAA